MFSEEESVFPIGLFSEKNVLLNLRKLGMSSTLRSELFIERAKIVSKLDDEGSSLRSEIVSKLDTEKWKKTEIKKRENQKNKKLGKKIKKRAKKTTKRQKNFLTFFKERGRMISGLLVQHIENYFEDLSEDFKSINSKNEFKDEISQVK